MPNTVFDQQQIVFSQDGQMPPFAETPFVVQPARPDEDNGLPIIIPPPPPEVVPTGRRPMRGVIALLIALMLLLGFGIGMGIVTVIH